MSQELYEAITNRPIHQWGQVVCFEADRKTMTLTEYGRTAVLPFMTALQAYGDIPNPASQLLQWTTEEEHIAAEAELQKNIKDPEWLEWLFDCI